MKKLFVVLSAFLVSAACLAQANEEKNPVKLLLPPAIYAVPGQEANIYFDNIVLVSDIKSVQFDVDCSKGRQDEKRWRFTPEAGDVGEYPLTVKVFDAKSKLLAEAATKIRVVAKDAGNGKKISCMILGDSLTGAALYPKELARLLKQEGNPEVKFIGVVPPTAEGVPPHEGRGGWAWATYHSHAKDDPNVNPPHYRRSPFVFKKEDGNNVFDFKEYCDKQNDGKAPDYITIFLGINDVFGAKDDNVESMIDKILENADIVTNEFRKVGPNTKIAVALTPPPAGSQDAFGNNYKCNQTRWQYRKNQHRLVERYMQKYANRESENFHVIPVYVNLDCENNYPKIEEQVNARNPKKVFRDNNGVHPALEGYLQIADSFYAWLKSELAKN